MSPWWLEPLRIGLAPDAVDLLRRRRFGRGAQQRRRIECRPGTGQPPWQAALDALEPELASWGRRGEAVQVVLSNHWVRYLVLPWQAQLGSAAELMQLARLRFEQTYGLAAQGWELRCSDGGYGAARVACAVERGFIDSLTKRLGAHGLRLASLQPLLMAAFNRFRHQLGRHAALAVAEPGRVCVALIENGCWRAIISRRAGPDLALTIEQELACLSSGPMPQRVELLQVGAESTWPDHAALPAHRLGSTRTALALGEVA